MKFGLVSEEMINGQMERNLNLIRKNMIEYRSKVDVLCFGESFLSGYASLTYDLEEDRRVTIERDDNLIKLLSVWARKYRIAVSFGYFENDADVFYSSVIFIGKDGSIVNNYRRRSLGWDKDKLLASHYGTGDCLIPFEYEGMKLLTIICQDMLEKDIYEEIKHLAVDVILWPVYLKQGKIFDQKRLTSISKISVPILVVNSFDREASGGCGHLLSGQLIDSIPENTAGVIIVDIND